MKRILLSLLLSFWLCNLSSAQGSKENITQLDSAIGKQSFFDGHLTGFILYDLDSKQVVFE
ncbi:MAG: D-alanyl-D-alanine carboxypeptidase, partial [Bacteroidetes bacterium]|nr:D-alanyl-D-alanine carboxypeptidase [Bacteroidota bacterium]